MMCVRDMPDTPGPGRRGGRPGIRGMTAGLTEACGGGAHPELSSFRIDVHVSESGSPHP